MANIIPRGATQEIEHRFIPNQTAQARLTSDIKSLNLGLERAKAAIESHKTTMITYQAAIKANEKVFNQLETLENVATGKEQEVIRTLLNICSNNIRVNEDFMRRAQEDTRYNERYIEDLEPKLEAMRLKLEALPEAEETVITSEAVKLIAKGMRTINPRTVKLAKYTNTRYIEWTFNTLYAPIDLSNSPNRWLFTNSKIYLPIGPVKVTVDLNRKQVYYNSGKANTTHKYYLRTKTVHPHITGERGQGCMGTLAGPMVEAIDRCDIEQIMTIAQMFLQTITTDDPAGRQWIKYFNSLPEIVRTVGSVGAHSVKHQVNRVYYGVSGRKGYMIHYHIQQDPETKAFSVVKQVNGSSRLTPINPDIQTICDRRRSNSSYTLNDRNRVRDRFARLRHIERAFTQPEASYVYTIEEALSA